MLYEDELLIDYKSCTYFDISSSTYWKLASA